MTVSKTAMADTYQPYPTFELGLGQGTVLGLTTGGTLVVYIPRACPSVPTGPEGGSCYDIYDPSTGTTTYSTTDPTNLTYDDGAACTPSTLPAGLYAVQAVCNNGHEATVALTDPDSPYSEVLYLGPDVPLFTRPANIIEITDLEIDSLGDVAFDLYSNGMSADEATGLLDETSRITPEPSAFVLFATGLLGGLIIARRRPKLAIN